MGTTLVAVIVKGDAVLWISVGDSPLYLVEDNRLERLNADHSMVPQIEELVARGVLTADEAARHPARHTLREAVMGERLTLIDQGSRSLQPGGRLLLCSDGIQSLADARIAEQAGQPVQALIEAVLAVGAPGQDNVTVIKLEREE
jgi:serine/threonine protein phosphatase PrpC